MNDNDIIKVGECIRGEKILCLSCSYRARFPDCRKYVIRDIFDLASRQKANVEGLINAVKYLNEQLSSAKAEVVKELLDKIEKQAIPNEDDVYWVELDDIYNLIKEMGVTVDEVI